jgi:hypothetical protein
MGRLRDIRVSGGWRLFENSRSGFSVRSSRGHPVQRIGASLLTACLLSSPVSVSAETAPPEQEDEGLIEEYISSWEAAEPEADDEDEAVNWVDTGHAYATGRSLALTRWMDDYFGDNEYLSEEADSQVRVEFINDWDSEFGNKIKVRARGNLQLPAISHRLALLFDGDDTDAFASGSQNVRDDLGLQYNVQLKEKSRFDVTMGISSGHLRPGIKYRKQGSFSNSLSYRFIERLQYEHGENIFSRTQFDLNKSFGDSTVLRWGSRLTYGEKTEGVEWRSSLFLRNAYQVSKPRPIVVNYFVSAYGSTWRKPLTKEYLAGVLVRRQVYRDYLFLEVEPSYVQRRREFPDERHDEWRIIFRLEIALQRDYARAPVE